MENLEDYKDFRLSGNSLGTDPQQYVDLAVDKVQEVLVDYATAKESEGQDYEVAADNLLGMILRKLSGLKSTY